MGINVIMKDGQTIEDLLFDLTVSLVKLNLNATVKIDSIHGNCVSISLDYDDRI